MRDRYLYAALIFSIVFILCSTIAFGSDLNGSEINCSEIKCEEVGMRIHDIQGAAHESPLAGYYVKDVAGMVTAVDSRGFYIQDILSDCSNATSEGLYVFTEKQPTVKVGNYTLISGIVYEYRKDEGLSLTEIKNPNIKDGSQNQSLPPAVIIGSGGRIPPDTVVDDDSLGEFNADNDGADFYESLEGMRVQINDALVLGSPKKVSGKMLIYVLADNGTDASLRSARGGILLRPGDANPERIAVSYKDGPKELNAGDRLAEPVTGVLTYDTYNHYYLVEIDNLTATSGNLTPELSTGEANQGELSIATFNVENLYSNDPKLKNLSKQIVFNLSLPDIIALQEVGDNNGDKDKEEHIVAADQTFGNLIKAVYDSSGIVYNYTNIDPLENKDGGAPGYNIRVGILYRTDNGLQFINRTGGDATSPTTIITDEQGKPHLSCSPGRIDPLNSAFDYSRKPLAAEFVYSGSSLFMIANHLNSKLGGDQSIYGANQPPQRPTENQRHKQAQVIRNFVSQILRTDKDANVVVLGDLNDFQFSETLNILKGGDLSDAIESLEPDQQYTYIHEGNSQALDHILLSKNLTEIGYEADVVHINSEFADRTSDHDPVVVRIRFK